MSDFLFRMSDFLSYLIGEIEIRTKLLVAGLVAIFVAVVGWVLCPPVRGVLLAHYLTTSALQIDINAAIHQIPSFWNAHYGIVEIIALLVAFLYFM